MPNTPETPNPRPQPATRSDKPATPPTTRGPSEPPEGAGPPTPKVEAGSEGGVKPAVVGSSPSGADAHAPAPVEAGEEVAGGSGMWGWLGKGVLYGVGVVFIGIGVHGIWADPRNVPVVGWGKWFLGGVLIHDLLFAPAVLLLAALVVRIPLPYRRILQAALVLGGSLTLVALPAVLGYGRRPDNPSQLPLPYGRNLVELLVAIAVVAVAMAAVSLAWRYGIPSGRAVDPEREHA